LLDACDAARAIPYLISGNWTRRLEIIAASSHTEEANRPIKETYKNREDLSFTHVLVKEFKSLRERRRVVRNSHLRVSIAIFASVLLSLIVKLRARSMLWVRLTNDNQVLLCALFLLNPTE